ncbi:hypothetical protein [Planobispora longispora]|uniref:hypothetical protein n=1 Tax=Planobispora longispora TaxID=28887 RepID=UPI00361E3577
MAHPARPPPHPAPEMFAHLTSVGFTATATPYAAITRGGELLALVTRYLPGARDGWEWCAEEAAAGRTAFAGELGALAADLHAALATPSAAFPDPVRPSPARTSWPTRAEAALREALELTDGEDGEWLAARAHLLAERFRVLADHDATPLIRIHGDLHVGQILRWRDGYAVIDFDGNPTVSDTDLFQPAARDLAQLSTSLEHAGQVAIKRRGADPAEVGQWAVRATSSLEDAYIRRLHELGHARLLHDGLLRAFAAEQECRELIYAARHLPRWRYAPMGVLRSWYR